MTDHAFYIETSRLYISHLLSEKDAHCDFLVSLYNTPEFIASIGGTTEITTREAARTALAGRFREQHARLGYGTYLVSLKTTTPNNNDYSGDDPSPSDPETLETSTPIGTVSLLRGLDPSTSYTAPDLGFAILTEYSRKGYTKEACLALLEYAEREKGVRDVLGLHNPENVASAGVFKSLGFADRGLRRLKFFGGVVGRVWTRPGMGEDLSVYGLPGEEEEEVAEAQEVLGVGMAAVL